MKTTIALLTALFWFGLTGNAQRISPNKIKLETICEDIQFALDRLDHSLSKEKIRFKEAEVSLKVSSVVEGGGKVSLYVVEVGADVSTENAQTLTFKLDTNTTETKRATEDLALLSEDALKMRASVLENSSDKSLKSQQTLATIYAVQKKIRVTEKLVDILTVAAKEIKQIRDNKEIRMKVKEINIELEFTVEWNAGGEVNIEVLDFGVSGSIGGGRSRTHTISLVLEIK